MPIDAPNPYPTRTQDGAYERNSRAFGPAAATVIGLADAAGRGSTDIGRGFAEVLQAVSEGSAWVADAAGEVTGEVAEQVGDVVEATVEALDDGASWLAEQASAAASNAAILALLIGAGAGTPGGGSTA